MLFKLKKYNFTTVRYIIIFVALDKDMNNQFGPR